MKVKNLYMEKQEECDHKDTIVAGDEDGYKIFCTACQLQEDESEYTSRRELQPL